MEMLWSRRDITFNSLKQVKNNLARPTLQISTVTSLVSKHKDSSPMQLSHDKITFKKLLRKNRNCSFVVFLHFLAIILQKTSEKSYIFNTHDVAKRENVHSKTWVIYLDV